MFENITQDWTLWRFLRLGIVIFLFIEGITKQEWQLVGVGVFLLYQVVFNVGCASGNCAVPEQKIKETKND